MSSRWWKIGKGSVSGASDGLAKFVNKKPPAMWWQGGLGAAALGFGAVPMLC